MFHTKRAKLTELELRENHGLYAIEVIQWGMQHIDKLQKWLHEEINAQKDKVMASGYDPEQLSLILRQAPCVAVGIVGCRILNALKIPTADIFDLQIFASEIICD